MWLTIEELAEYLKVSKETIYKLAQGRKIPGSKIGNQWRFKQDVIDKWFTSSTEDPIKGPISSSEHMKEIK
jgi:excisionase family DNA binding protein